MTHPTFELLRSSIINIDEAIKSLDKLSGFNGSVNKDLAIYHVLVQSRRDLNVIKDRLGHYVAHGADTYPRNIGIPI
jgi:hypothetical protein